MEHQLATKTKTQSGKSKSRKGGKPSFIEQARRKQILDVATQLFATKGFSRTSIEEIAEAVDVSRGVIFYYFNGKRELGEETIKQGLRDYGDYVQARVATKRKAQGKLLEFVDACVDFTTEHRSDYLLFADTIGCFSNSDDKYRLLAWVNQRTRQLLVGLIEEGQASGEIARVPATELADVIQSLVDGMMQLAAVEPDQVNAEGCKKLIRTMLLSVIKP